MNRRLVAVVGIVPVLLTGCFNLFDIGDDDDGYCECPPDYELPPCAATECQDGECVIYGGYGLPRNQVDGDCETLLCLGDVDPYVGVDDSDQDDNNPCTVDSCEDGAPLHTALEVGTVCGDNAVCTAAGDCLTCDDGNDCTTEECSTGELLVTSTQPEGTPCANGGICQADGSCFTCDDGNECTVDDCSVMPPTHANAPLGTACGGGSGVCDSGTCVTWCLPLPDPATCPDTGTYEATDDSWDGQPQFPEDDDAPRPICGVLTPGDEDWISYYAEDESFETDINDFQLWSFGNNIRVCAFAECDAGTTNAPCEDGGSFASGPNGEPGCCWQGVFNNLAYFSMNLECDGTDDDQGWVRIRIDNPGDAPCAPYGLLDYGY
jgi:hypothetical protein